MNHIVIMAGGVGSRLYPLSTPEHPKQFIDLLGRNRTMIQMTYDRFLTVDPNAEFWVVTSENYAHFVREQLPDLKEDHILLEPVSRNTAPCIAYASWKIASCDPDACVIVTPADAYVPDYNAFAVTMTKAVAFAQSKKALVCVGIAPSSPHTGYGYIFCGAPQNDYIRKVDAFKEKPDLKTACQYLEDGRYLWNAGIFVWKVSAIMEELREFEPQISGIMDEIALSFGTDSENDVLRDKFPDCDKISIDYAVMEKSASVFVAPGHWLWSDLGSFESIEAVRASEK